MLQLRHNGLPELWLYEGVEGDAILRLVCLKKGDAEIIVGGREKRGGRRIVLQPKADVPKREDPVAGRTHICLARVHKDGVGDVVSQR